MINMFCPNCGTKLDDNVSFCPNCGAAAKQYNQNAAPVYAQPQQTPVIVNVSNVNTNTNNVHGGMPYPPKSRIVALLLCFFLGVLGIHRFYVGKMGTGIIWLLTGGFFGIGALIDFLMILFGSFRDKAGYPLA